MACADIAKRVATCLFLVIGCVSVRAAADGLDPELQRAFVDAGHLLQSGDYAGAERIFRALLRRTDSPRVKLELARTLFYEKRYREARALFKEVQLEPELPWQVRDNIEAFVRRIDNIVGYVKGSVALVSDSNPENITSQRQFTIAGVRLNFQPPSENRKVTGLRYLIEAFQPLSRERRLSSYLTGAYTDYPGHTLDRLTMDMGIAQSLGAQAQATLKAGVEWGTFGGRQLYRFPYAAGFDVLSQTSRFRITGEAKAGQVRFPYYTYLDADYIGLSASATRALSATVAASFGATAEGSWSRERAYSYSGLAFAPGIAWLLANPALLVQADLSAGSRQYAAVDPLFGKQRFDRKRLFKLAVTGKEWRLMGRAPVLILSLEKNASNIDFYSYSKASVSVGLQ